jgi:hypothetical protein
VTVYEATEAELLGLGAVESSRGQVALVMASALDSGKGLDAMASIAKQLEAHLQLIRDAAPPAEDPIEELIQDEVAERRDSKPGSGGGSRASGVVRTTQRVKRVGR